MAALSKADYLKRYISGDPALEDKKKKKKKKLKKILKTHSRVKIVDDDVDLKSLLPGNLENTLEEDVGDNEPTIAEIVDERPEEVQRLEKYRQDDSEHENTENDDDHIHHECRHDSDSDQSPVRKGRHDSDSDQSPMRKGRHDSDSDQSPVRKGRHDSDSDLSPVRKSKHDSDYDQSPARQHHSNKTNKLLSQSKNGRRLSPAHSASKSKSEIPAQSPPRRKSMDSDSDQSPPRRQRKGSDSDQSPPRRNRKDSDSDQSPPRRKRKDSDSDQSPPRRKRKDSDSDQSHPRRKRKDSDSDQSPPRRKRKGSDLEQSPQRKQKAKDSLVKPQKTLSGAKAGLSSAKDVRKETELLRKRHDAAFNKIDEELLGKNARTVFRDRKTGKRRNLKEEQDKQDEENAKKLEEDKKYELWGKGLKQVSEQDQAVSDAIHEMSKPLARARDDKDLDDMLRKMDREGDPMAAFLTKKATSKKTKEKPQFKGPYPPNRFGIRPGYRWDGVDRSNGFEKQYFAKMADRKATNDMAYKWSIEDM
ncbi:LOW QUALITY PROTEIN: BUD13 homolog [Liolophura sinensis]|uniref:LOW QUALITY PROTEIN: BUD13 homolog n=1 Tax=Liolophura sinensis TaxID=3198878 RepID=UPI0031583E52